MGLSAGQRNISCEVYPIITCMRNVERRFGTRDAVAYLEVNCWRTEYRVRTPYTVAKLLEVLNHLNTPLPWLVGSATAIYQHGLLMADS